jgi:acyl-CoA thioesterase-1
LKAHEKHETHEIEPMPMSFRRYFRLPGILLFLSLACAVGRLTASDTRIIVFFGDSLTAGYGLADPSSQAYPALIQEKIDEAGLPWRAVNAGLSGETTSGGLRRVDWILRQPVDIFVLALGANDGLRGIDPSVSRANLQKIVDRVRAKNPKVKLVLAGMQMPPAMGQDFAREFEQMFPDVAEKNDATLVPFLLDGVGGRLEFNQSDRIHPTASGHARIAETVWKVLRPLL